MAHELELKFEVARPRLLALAKSPWLRSLSEDELVTRKLVSVYYDTKDRDLRDQELSLRVRRVGVRHVQTIKARSARALDRCEWEEPVPGGRPDRALARRSALKPFTGKKQWRRLRPLFETTISRTSLEIMEGQSQISVALDHGYVKTKRRRLTVSEVELELKQGEPADLLALARKFSAKLPLALGVESKAERGYALANGETASSRKANFIPLGLELTSEEGFRAIAMACLAQAAANRDAILRNDPEGIHQMRVGIRRLRTALALFKDMIDGPETDEVKYNLKWLGEQLGPARDFDVLQENSVKPMQADDPANQALIALEDDVAERRTHAFQHARHMVESDRYRQILLETGLWVMGGDWARDEDNLRIAQRHRALIRTANEILDARVHKVVKKLKSFDKMDARKRHKLRIAVKKLRYATGFFESILSKHGKRQKRFDATLKRLQSALGRLNDIRVHASLADKTIFSAGRAKRLKTMRTKQAFGFGQLTGREKADAEACLEEAGRAGKAFSALKPYWP
jgi:inorganic triphosphatase YgiF